jgi:uncharacterized protein YjbI with pentapeptide repeats
MNTATLTEEYASGNRNFQGRHLSGVNLGWATLAEANFRDADFYGANLSGASLKQADLSGKTNLAFADLSRADLTSVDLRGANLEGANLDGTVLDSAVYDEHTIFPRGFDPDTAGAITAKAKLEAFMRGKRLSTAVASSVPAQASTPSTPQILQSNASTASTLPETSQIPSISTTLFTSTATSVDSSSATVQTTSNAGGATIRPESPFFKHLIKSWKPWLISLGLGIGIPVIGLLLMQKPNVEPYATPNVIPYSEEPAPSPIESLRPSTQTETASSEKNTVQQITKQEAITLLENWLKAKEQIFGASYNTQLVNQFTTGQVYEEIMSADGSLPWLKQNNGYYRYGEQNVAPSGSFEVGDRQAIIDARIVEEIFYYESNAIQKSWTNNQTYRFILALEDGQWKISGRSKISN